MLFGNGQKTFHEVLQLVRKDESIYKAMLKKGDSNLVMSLFHTVSDELFMYVDMIKMPAYFRPQQLDKEMIEKLTIWVFDLACVLYSQFEEENDFFLLHGVTGAWALRKILELVDDIKVALRAI